MKTTITQFRGLSKDGNGNDVPLGEGWIASETRTSAGAFTALDANAAIIRVASDTSIHMKSAGGTTTDQHELIFANVPEYFAVNGGETLEIILA